MNGIHQSCRIAYDILLNFNRNGQGSPQELDDFLDNEMNLNRFEVLLRYFPGPRHSFAYHLEIALF
jgi:hypothetical protein